MRKSQVILTVLAVSYLGFVFLAGARSKIPSELLPRPFLYFVQTACLFPKASVMRIDYRIEVQHCGASEFKEIEIPPLFPIHPNDKENRYYRAMFFHRRNADVMRELDMYVQKEASTSDQTIAHIRFLSLRIPFPEFGSDYPRYVYLPSDAYSEEERKIWWKTPVSMGEERCKGTS